MNIEIIGGDENANNAVAEKLKSKGFFEAVYVHLNERDGSKAACAITGQDWEKLREKPFEISRWVEPNQQKP